MSSFIVVSSTLSSIRSAPGLFGSFGGLSWAKAETMMVSQTSGTADLQIGYIRIGSVTDQNVEKARREGYFYKSGRRSIRRKKNRPQMDEDGGDHRLSVFPHQRTVLAWPCRRRGLVFLQLIWLFRLGFGFQIVVKDPHLRSVLLIFLKLYNISRFIKFAALPRRQPNVGQRRQ